MPFLAFLPAIGSAITSMFGYFMLMFGRKFSVTTASILAFIATTIAFIVCLKSILAAVIAALVIPSWLLYVIGLFIPSNAISMLSSILSARICRSAYEIIKFKIDLATKAN